MTRRPLIEPWTPSVPEGRWAGLGPYYAMFPVSFVRSVLEEYCPANAAVIDPFCGRGTVPFVATANGRDSLGIDSNEVAWVYSSAKTNPSRRPGLLKKRVAEISARITQRDRQPENEFQQWAWCPEVLGFLHSARRNLDWENSIVDRTLMALILVHLHGKVGSSLSNQIRQSKAMAPDYAVRWWKNKKFLPPQIDPVEYLQKRIDWRYAKGVPPVQAKTRIIHGDAAEVLTTSKGFPKFGFLFTSPPYMGVTNYRYDNWIRLWMLGERPHPKSESSARHSNPKKYEEMINNVFTNSRNVCRSNVVVYVRTDARKFTLDTNISALSKAWPNHFMHFRSDKAKQPTQTALFGDAEEKVGEVDILLTPNKIEARGFNKKPPK